MFYYTEFPEKPGVGGGFLYDFLVLPLPEY